jgi:hypothetical protein
MAMTRSSGRVRSLGVGRDAQHEVSAERKAGERDRQTGEFRRQCTHRAHHLRQAAGVEQLAVQVMSRTVIAQVEAHDFESSGEQAARECQLVGRVRAAFPPVQQHDQLAARIATGLSRGWNGRPEA